MSKAIALREAARNLKRKADARSPFWQDFDIPAPIAAPAGIMWVDREGIKWTESVGRTGGKSVARS